MITPFKDCMTKEMLYITNSFEKNIKCEIFLCEKNIIILENIINKTQLPMKNKQGIQIVFGAKKQIINQLNYWKKRLDLSKYY